MDRAARYLLTNYNPKGQRIGWLMMASILVEAWDLYSIAFVLIFIRDITRPHPRSWDWLPPGRKAARLSAP
jgi:hypothetical protein